MIANIDHLCKKTIFVLVHTSDLLLPSGFEVSLEPKRTAYPNPVIYSKTLWSSVVESCMEYVRVIYDVFGNDRQLYMVVIDAKEKVTIGPNSPQGWRHWLKTFAEIGAPQNATQSLSTDSVPGFASVRSIFNMGDERNVIRGGRVIVIGYRMGDNIVRWADEINALFGVDDVQDGKQYSLESEWVFLDVEATTETIQTEESCTLVQSTSQSRHRVFRQTTFANKDLHRALMLLSEQHHHLACTRVQNIPMKEDTSNTQSAMYEVELIHPRVVHQQIRQAGLLPLMTSPQRPLCGLSSCIVIKWVTPRQTVDIDYYNTSTAHRVTTADVCHRASCCLANFVLEGRSVVLEIDQGLLPVPPPGLPDPRYELLLLTSHSGVLYVHSLFAHRDPLLDASLHSKPPCLSEIGTKKTTNRLRINDFCQLILSNRLAPAPANLASTAMERSLREVEQHTRYWPELTSDTIVFNRPLMAKVFEILVKKHLEFSEKSNCIAFLQQMIFDQSSSTDKSSTSTAAGKKQQHDNRAFKTELELLLWLYRDRSSSHREILESFDVFANTLQPLLDISAIMSDPPPAAAVPAHSGLSRLDYLLRDGGHALRQLLSSHGNNKTTSVSSADGLLSSGSALGTGGLKVANGVHGRKQQRRPELGQMTLREALMAAAESQQIPKRKRFDGELAAVDNFTELYPPSLPTAGLPAEVRKD